MRLPSLTVAAVALVALAGACSQQDDPTVAELREDLVEELREVRPSMTADQAECYAELLVRDEADVEELVDVKFSESEPDAEDGLDRKIAEAAVQAREDCGLADAPR